MKDIKFDTRPMGRAIRDFIANNPQHEKVASQIFAHIVLFTIQEQIEASGGKFNLKVEITE